MRTELVEGLRYVFGDRYLRSLIACTGAWNLFSSMGLAVLLVYLVRRLGFAPEELGGVFTLGSIGAFSGALVARPLGARLGIGRGRRLQHQPAEPPTGDHGPACTDG